MVHTRHEFSMNAYSCLGRCGESGRARIYTYYPPSLSISLLFHSRHLLPPPYICYSPSDSLFKARIKVDKPSHPLYINVVEKTECMWREWSHYNTKWMEGNCTESVPRPSPWDRHLCELGPHWNSQSSLSYTHSELIKLTFMESASTLREREGRKKKRKKKKKKKQTTTQNMIFSVRDTKYEHYTKYH